MDLSGTGGQLWTLTSGNNDNPTLTPGNVTKWDLNDVPDRCPSGPLAYYLPGAFLTIAGTVTQASESSTFPFGDLVFALIDSIDWVNAWHGTPVSANHVKGTDLRIVEFVGGGYRFAQRTPNFIPSTAGAYPFKITVWIPAAARYGKLLKDTSQLALLFQPSSIKVNVAPSSALTSIAGGATFTGGLTARISVPLVPRQEIVLGSPAEWILHQVVAGTNSPAIKITGFGRDTMLTGVKPKGGVAWLGELTNDPTYQQGLFAAEAVTQFSFPWRGQQVIYDIDAWSSSLLQSLPNDRPNTSPTPSGGATTNDEASLPYWEGNIDNLSSQLIGQRAFTIVQGGDDLRVTDLQTADTDQTYFLTVNGGFSPGDHQILAHYIRQWEDAKRADFLTQVTKGPNSLASYVLGAGLAKAQLRPRAPRDKHVLTADQTAYLPWQLI